MLNEISEDFGTEFWSSKSDAELAWTDVTPECQSKITECLTSEFVDMPAEAQ